MNKYFQNLRGIQTMMLMVIVSLFCSPAYAQEEDFRPCKGICWGLFFDDTAEQLQAPLVPVEYIRPQWDKYIFPDFVGCGRDLILDVLNEDVNPGYYQIQLSMEGGQYDDYGYFYPPFTDGDFKWSFDAPYDQIIGPILQPYSYFYPDLEYIGLYYLRYPEKQFGYFDIKTQEDYYDDVTRTYLTDEEIADYAGITHAAASPSLDDTYYNLLGRRAQAGDKGILIENGRKVIR